MFKLKPYLLPLVLAIAFGLGILLGGKISFNDTPEQLFTTNSKKDKLNRLIDYIDYEYVDEVNTDSIVDVTVNNILEKLDPHSVYIPREDADKIAENMKGDFVGVGISFYMYRDTLAVIRPIPGGPSEKAGIHSGDRILEANGEVLHGKNLPSEKVIELLKGGAEGPVALKVFRPVTGKTFKVDIRKSRVPLPSVDAFYMLTGDMGYIKLNRFAESSYDEFHFAMKLLQTKGMTKLTLDLRDNPGGYLGIAEQIADEFLEDNTLILFTKNKSGAIDRSFASSKGNFEKGEIYVLINERSASASEIIAGAIQDNDRGTVIGRRSFGKGLVQREMALGDGSAVRLTVSRYYTPTGRSIQMPYNKGNQAYYEAFHHRFENGELIEADSIKVADSLIFKTPKGKIVYGGGGIVPDVFVPLSENKQENLLHAVLDSGFMGFYVFQYLDGHRSDLVNMKEEEFLSEFEVSEEMLDDFISYALDRGLRISASEYGEQLRLYYKATLAEQLYGRNSYEYILGQEDPMLNAVLKMTGN